MMILQYKMKIIRLKMIPAQVAAKLRAMDAGLASGR